MCERREEGDGERSEREERWSGGVYG